MARDLQQSGRLRDNDDETIEPPQIRSFRRLVSLLMVVMMVGILAIAGALVWKLTQPGSSLAPPTATDIPIPAGFEVKSVSSTGSRLYLVIEHLETGKRTIEERRASDSALIGVYRLVPAGGN